jgi:hypothetical protein
MGPPPMAPPPQIVYVQFYSPQPQHHIEVAPPVHSVPVVQAAPIYAAPAAHSYAVAEAAPIYSAPAVQSYAIAESAPMYVPLSAGPSVIC